MDPLATAGITGGHAFVPPDSDELAVARQAALLAKGDVVSVHFPTGYAPVVFLKANGKDATSALEVLARGGIVKPDAEITLPSSYFLKTAREGGLLRQSVLRHQQNLRALIGDGHLLSMMVLRGVASSLLRAEAVYLSGKAQEAFHDKKEQLAEAKVLLLLHVIKYENADLFAEFWTRLKNNFEPENFFTNLADVVTARHLEAAEKRVLLSWGRQLFPEQDFSALASLNF